MRLREKIGRVGRLAPLSFVQGVTRESRSCNIRPAIEEADQQVLIGLAGPFNCCDVYLSAQLDDRGDLAGWSPCHVSLWAKSEPMETMLTSKLVGDHDGVVLGTAGRRRMVKALILSVRGRPAAEFEVRANAPTLRGEAKRYAKGLLLLEAWGDQSSLANDDQTRTIIDPFAGREKYLYNSLALSVGDNDVLALPTFPTFPLRQKRIWLTHLSLFTTQVAPAIVNLETVDAAAATQTVASFVVSAASPVQVSYTYALRGEPGGFWRIVAPALQPATTTFCNISGFMG